MLDYPAVSRWLPLTEGTALHTVHPCRLSFGGPEDCIDAGCHAEAVDLTDGASVEELNRLEHRTVTVSIAGAFVAVVSVPFQVPMAATMVATGDIRAAVTIVVAGGILVIGSLIFAGECLAGHVANLVSARRRGDRVAVEIDHAERLATQVRTLDRQGRFDDDAALHDILDAARCSLGLPSCCAEETIGTVGRRTTQDCGSGCAYGGSPPTLPGTSIDHREDRP